MPELKQYHSDVFLSAIQMTSTVSVEENLKTVSTYLAQITKESVGQHLVVLPECCLFFGGSDKKQLLLAKETAASNSLMNSLSALAKQYQVYLVAGSIPLICDDGLQFTNSSLCFSPLGELVSRYDKIHLFDVDVGDNSHYKESKCTKGGNKPVLASLPFANVGLTICFDLRFPTLFQTLTQCGADIITVPSAFTRVTGKAHWQTLLQARAIENQVYIIASGQEGVHENGRETWGHSMIISPWGEVLQCLAHGTGYITVAYKPNEIERIRASMPLKHVPL